jgi:hypothetical protein
MAYGACATLRAMDYDEKFLERSRTLKRAQLLTPEEFFEVLVEMAWFERVESAGMDVFKVTKIGLQELYHLDYSGAGWCDQ